MLVLCALAVTVVIGIVRTASAPIEKVPVAASSHAEPEPSTAKLYVHVSGAVAVAGLYVLDDASRVMDAIAAAGGLDEKADAAAVNLARPLTDGEQLHVPEVGETPRDVPGTPGAVAGGAINLNTADLTTLETLPGIGPALGSRIVAWREANGPFENVEDLLAVAGIGEKVLAGLRDLVVV